MELIRQLWMDDEGQDLAEYGILLVLIAVAVIAGVTLFKNQITSAFSRATSALATT